MTYLSHLVCLDVFSLIQSYFVIFAEISGKKINKSNCWRFFWFWLWLLCLTFQVTLPKACLISLVSVLETVISFSYPVQRENLTYARKECIVPTSLSNYIRSRLIILACLVCTLVQISVGMINFRHAIDHVKIRVMWHPSDMWQHCEAIYVIALNCILLFHKAISSTATFEGCWYAKRVPSCW